MHFDYKINMWAAGGLVRCRSGRRGVGNGRRRREREREERKCRQRVGVASGMARERERRMELAWWERQESKWAAANAAEATAAKAAAAGVAARWWVRRQFSNVVDEFLFPSTACVFFSSCFQQL